VRARVEIGRPRGIVGDRPLGLDHQELSAFERNREVETGHRGDPAAPGAHRVDDDVSTEGGGGRLSPDDTTATLDTDVGDRRAGADLHASVEGRLVVALDRAVMIEVAVRRAVRGADEGLGV
jgi:hypothetical protein